MRPTGRLASATMALISCQGNMHCLITLLIVSYFHEGTLAGDSFSPDSQAARATEGAGTTPTLLLPSAWVENCEAVVGDESQASLRLFV